MCIFGFLSKPPRSRRCLGVERAYTSDRQTSCAPGSRVKAPRDDEESKTRDDDEEGQKEEATK